MTESEVAVRLELYATPGVDRIVARLRELHFEDHACRAVMSLASLDLDTSDRALDAWFDWAAAMGVRVDVVTEAVIDATCADFERLKSIGVRARRRPGIVSFGFRGEWVDVKAERKEVHAHLITLAESFRGAFDAQRETLGCRLTYN